MDKNNTPLEAEGKKPAAKLTKSQLIKKQQRKRKLNKIIAMLYNDARFSKEDVTLMVKEGRLCDIEDVIDLEKV